MQKTPQSILKTIFGYDEFRPLQKEIIENILQRKDTLVIMPTGGGKSLCYQIPALIFDGLTIVISPLISLMKDQVEQLVELGVDAAFLNSSLSPQEYQRTVDKVKNKSLKLLYMAPEGLLTDKILTLLSTQKVDCLTIDEAHCISEWGHDFRPEYRQLAKIRKKYPRAVCIALTATATPRVQKDIQVNLEFDASNEFIASFNRENLFLEIIPKNNPAMQTLELLRKYPDQSGIVYCLTRNQVDELAAFLAAHDFSVKPYHAGLADDDRKRNQELFIKDDVQIIVATIAFGMGINKPNVRFVVHYDLPKNIESYYQQIGRAGRDGLRSHCLLLFGYGDLQKIRYFIDKMENERERRIAYIHLDALVGLAETQICRRIPMLNYFGENYHEQNCGMCDNCVRGKKEMVDITVAAQKFLSCIKRTEELFGANHIVDVLRGSENKKVLDFGHHHLSTYGIGKEYSKQQWLHLARQFITNGLLKKDLQYGSLKLTEKATAVLFQNEKVMGMVEEEKPAFSRIRDIDLDYDRPLFDLLRKKRKEIADRQNLPPYIIFSDKSLMEMAAFFPQSRRSLLDMHGVGVTKINRYGTAFLDIICKYCAEHHIKEKQKSGQADIQTMHKPVKGKRHIEIGEAFAKTQSILELSTQFGIKQSTIVTHLLQYVLEGHNIPAGDMLALSSLTPVEQKTVLATFDRLGTKYLKPVYEELGETIDYEKLHLLRVYYLSQGRKTDGKN